MPTPSEQSRIEFPSRISARAVLVGATVALVLLSVLVGLGGGFGLLPSGTVLDAASVREAGVGFVVWGALSWIASAFVGAFVAAVTARSTLRRDGLLHGIATWAVACAAAGLLSCVWFMAAISTDLASRDLASVFWTKGAFFGYVIADVLAASAALTGGVLGARSEIRAASRGEIVREQRAPLGAPPVPQPT